MLALLRTPLGKLRRSPNLLAALRRPRPTCRESKRRGKEQAEGKGNDRRRRRERKGA